MRSLVICLGLYLTGCAASYQSYNESGAPAYRVRSTFEAPKRVVVETFEKAVLELGYTIDSSDPGKGEIIGKSPMSAFSVGETFLIRIQETSKNVCTVSVQAKALLVTNITANPEEVRRNILVRASAIFDRVATSVPTSAPSPVATTRYAPSDVDVPPKARRVKHDDVAVVIGIERYANQIPAVRYATRDADTVRRYLTEGLGFKTENVISLIDEQATYKAFDKVFAKGGQVDNYLKPQSNLFIYYAGHGAPDLKSHVPFLIPFDGDPNYVSLTGYSLQTLYDKLGALPAKSVTLVMDACFTGAASRADNEMLIANARPLFIKTEEVSIPAKVTVLAAASGNQVSSAFVEKEHGLFTYFFLKSLQGDADTNRDGLVTAKESHRFVAEQVRDQARRQNREQTPVMLGKDAYLVR